jgi:hypothetical protein
MNGNSWWLASFPFGASLTRPSVAHELAAQVIGIKSFALPVEPSRLGGRILRCERVAYRFTMSYSRSTSAAVIGETTKHGTILFIT